MEDATAPVLAQRGGTHEALITLRRFIVHKLKGYTRNRNQPELDGTSRLSSYLHFGHIGPHTVALAVQKSGAPLQDRSAFLEELIVRRELAHNFVRFNSHYETFHSGEPWANGTLRIHATTSENTFTLKRNWRMRKLTTRSGTQPKSKWC